MTEDSNILLRSDIELIAHKQAMPDRIRVSLELQNAAPALLHWGLCAAAGRPWHRPPKSAWPAATTEFDQDAVRTPFRPVEGDQGQRITIEIPMNEALSCLAFLIFIPEQKRWVRAHGRDFCISLGVPGESPMEELRREHGDHTVTWQHSYALGQIGQIAISVIRELGRYQIALASDVPGPLVLHWGAVQQRQAGWKVPARSIWPSQTRVVDDRAVQTPFNADGPLRRLTIALDEQEAPREICFVLYQPDGNRWLKHLGGDVSIPLRNAKSRDGDAPEMRLGDLIKQIVDSEMGRNSWTLMHRFNLCHDLLPSAAGDEHALAVLFVWLRYSAIRQLAWQRRYNTKPRELSHAQDRLTLQLAQLYRDAAHSREFVRLILTTLGPGGEGQRIRDEILEIMHRHRIKEVCGHFMEEWHQKLHNNTTPDDIAICEAYLEFLRTDGDLARFYDALLERSVTKQRLASYERPITTDPNFVPQLKAGLIEDFEHFLGTIKAVHAGTDLASAIRAAGDALKPSTQKLLNEIWQRRDADGITATELVTMISKARLELDRCIAERNQVRDLLFLDLALQDVVRTTVESSVSTRTRLGQLLELTGLVLENCEVGDSNAQLGLCLRHWRRLMHQRQLATGDGESFLASDWALRVYAVIDRVRRLIADDTDRLYRLLQPKAEQLGRAFGAEAWTISLFSEEVVRGRILFVLSLLLRHLDPLLRQMAKLSDWQVISPATASGQLEVVSSLLTVRTSDRDRSMVVVADRVGGDEEIPPHVTAVITPDTPDLVSHVAVRARNAHVLFATCYNTETIAKLKHHAGELLRLSVMPSGDVTVEALGDSLLARGPVGLASARGKQPSSGSVFREFALPERRFTEEDVGAKSNNLRRLRALLPDWVGLPESVAIPFAVFDRVLCDPANRAIASDHERLLTAIEQADEQLPRSNVDASLLTQLKACIEALEAPPPLIESLRSVATASGIGWPEDASTVWSCIRQVWASKWNERATLSRRVRGPDHRDLSMAVLIQQLVPAEYAFVIHTVHPTSGQRDELYAEVVIGLGETLVGNYPGRALAFTSKKGEPGRLSGDARVVSYPSKSVGLFGKGLICRSDSSGEDLPGQAGAGLYDSILVSPPQLRLLDYSEERLLWDRAFQAELLGKIGEVGLIVERAFGTAQDVEGAYCDGRLFVLQSRPQVGIDD